MSEGGAIEWIRNPTVAASCTICHGTHVWSEDDLCTSCQAPDAATVRHVLRMLEPKHMAFLRAYHHTLAYQPVTGEEWDRHQCFYVEDDDAVIDENTYDLVMPPTRHWFGSGMARLGHGGINCWIKYNPLGLALRECIMAGADAAVR